ncbi:MAG: 3-oxoacyl-ACP synthase [Cyclobacteriaceae bacterium]
MNSVKHQLYALCLSSVTEKIILLLEIIRSAQLSANAETKSSMGDKYETGRAMAQLEIEKNSAQLAEVLKSKDVLERLSPDTITSTAQVGSLVITNQGNYYLAVAAGRIELNGRTFYIISPASPLAQKLLGCKVSDAPAFRDKSFVIQEIL